MFCTECGTDNANGVSFCKNCGKPLKGAKPARAMGAKPAKSGESIAEKIKKLPKKAKIGIVAGIVAVIAVIVAIVVILNIKSVIKINDYVTCEATGYNGFGRAEVKIDWEKMFLDHNGDVKVTSLGKRATGPNASGVEILKSYIRIEYDYEAAKNLTNGSEIPYTIVVDESYKQFVKCKLKIEDGTVKVDGLEEVLTFDAFADVVVTYEGSAPNGTARLEYSGAELSSYDFSIDKTSGLSNGDVITVTINDYSVENCIENYGKAPASATKEYTVEGLDEYLDSFDKLPEDFLNTVKSETEDTIMAYVANSYNGGSSLSDLKYSGYFMLSPADPESYTSPHNALYMIYSGTVSNSEGDFEPTTVYYPVKFDNIMKSAEGVSYTNKSSIQGYSSIPNSGYSTNGYISQMNCYVELAANNTNYVVEAGDDFASFANAKAITSLSDIADTYNQTFVDKAIAEVNGYVASNSNFDDELSLSELTYVGNYLLISKEETGLRDSNTLFVVLTATLSSSEGEFSPITVYFPVEFKGVAKISDDNYSVTETKGIYGRSSIPDCWYSIDGYLEGSEMYNDIISANRERNTYEVSSELQMFGN